MLWESFILILLWLARVSGKARQRGIRRQRMKGFFLSLPIRQEIPVGLRPPTTRLGSHRLAPVVGQLKADTKAGLTLTKILFVRKSRGLPKKARISLYEVRSMGKRCQPRWVAGGTSIGGLRPTGIVTVRSTSRL